jgi:putative two-component system response regulator
MSKKDNDINSSGPENVSSDRGFSDKIISTTLNIASTSDLEQALNIYSKTLESISTGVTITNLDGIIIYTNSAEAKMHGYTKDELIGSHVSVLSPIKTMKTKSIDEVMKYKEFAREVINKRSDGTNLPVLLKSVPIMDVNGIPKGVISISEDITGKKERELEIIHVLTRTAEYRDKHTANHIKRIGLFSRYISEKLGMDHTFCQDIEYASAMHDVGKIGIPDSILLKEAALTEEEFNVIKQHTTIGADLLSTNTSNNIIALGKEVALNHHEKWDGTGYPAELKADAIPLIARIVAFADHYDALRSGRPYRRGLRHDEVAEILINGDGRTMPSHFDPDILKIFVSNHTVFDDIFKELTRIPDLPPESIEDV